MAKQAILFFQAGLSMPLPLGPCYPPSMTSRRPGIPLFGLNRFDNRSVAHFAADVRRAEELGWDAAFQNDSALLRRDPYVMLAAAAAATSQIRLGTLVVNPVTRHPAALANSAATVDELAPGRTLLGVGSGGEIGVRSLGLEPRRLRDFEAGVKLMKGLLAGESVDVGAARPAVMQIHRPVPVWVAAGGFRTHAMAGTCADGVFIRIGAAHTPVADALRQVHDGAERAGRDPSSVRVGLIIDTVLNDDATTALAMAQARASVAGGGDGLVSPGEASRFSLWGGPERIGEQAAEMVRTTGTDLEYVVFSPVPEPEWPEAAGSNGFTTRLAMEVLPALRRALA